MTELYRRLRRELVRSPKKSAILAIGLVVAGIFWAPLIWKKPKTGAARPADTTATAAESATVVATSTIGAPLATSPPQAATGEPTWSELLVWMRTALGEQSTERVATITRDPFEAADPTLAAAAIPEEETETEAAGAVVAEDPDRAFVAGLPVQGALKVGERRFVRLAGKTLGKGDRFDPGGQSEGDYDGDDWIVVEVDADSVTVQPVAGGEPLRLTLHRSGLPGLHLKAAD